MRCGWTRSYSLSERDDYLNERPGGVIVWVAAGIGAFAPEERTFSMASRMPCSHFSLES